MLIYFSYYIFSPLRRIAQFLFSNTSITNKSWHDACQRLFILLNLKFIFILVFSLHYFVVVFY